MYALNPLPVNVLITPDEVTRYFPGNSIDPNIWSSVIQLAETRFVVPILGYNFYQQFCAQKNVVVTSGNQAALQALFPANYNALQISNIVNAIDLITVSSANLALWNNVLWPFIAQCVMFTALPANYAKFTSQGIQKNNPSPTFIDGSAGGTSAGISLNDLKYLRNDVLLQNISVMQEALEKFIYANATQYPLVPCESYNKWGDDKVKDTRTSGIVFIYDEDDCDDKRRNYNNAPPPTPLPIPQTRACTLVLNIVASPNPAHQYLLCNLQTIPLEYPAGNTLTIPHLVGLTVNPTILIGLTNVYCPTVNGVLDNTAGGGFQVSSDPLNPTQVIINYNEVVGS